MSIRTRRLQIGADELRRQLRTPDGQPVHEVVPDSEAGRGLDRPGTGRSAPGDMGRPRRRQGAPGRLLVNVARPAALAAAQDVELYRVPASLSRPSRARTRESRQAHPDAHPRLARPTRHGARVESRRRPPRRTDCSARSWRQLWTTSSSRGIPAFCEGQGSNDHAERPVISVAAGPTPVPTRSIRAIGHWCSSLPGQDLRFGEAAALRRERPRPRSGHGPNRATARSSRAGSFMEGPPKTDAGRRTIALPPHVVPELRSTSRERS